MRYYNLHPHVICVGARNRVLKANIAGGFPETWWNTGELDKLVKEGFLEELKSDDSPADYPNMTETEEDFEEVKPEITEPETLEEDSSVEDGETEEEESEEEEEENHITYQKATIEGLRELLTLRGIEFNPEDGKPELYKLYKG